MNFYIKQNATLPILTMELVNDGRLEYNSFHDKIQNAEILFTMIDVNTNIKRIANKAGICVLKEPTNESIGEEYYVGYQFTEKDTKKKGVYNAHFKITFNDGSGTLIAPIRDELFVHII